MDDSPLSKLPPELRVMVYEFALLEEDTIFIYWPKGPVRYNGPVHDWTMPGILQVCRQIRTEAGPVYFGGNTFNCDTTCHQRGKAYSPHNMLVSEWLEVMGEIQRKMLRRIRVDDLTYAPEEVKGRVQNFKEEMNRCELGVDQATVLVELHEDGDPDTRSYVYVSE